RTTVAILPTATLRHPASDVISRNRHTGVAQPMAAIEPERSRRARFRAHWDDLQGSVRVS
ncbi:MAG TPA: hypothetical protein VLM40_10160, partial [Gemmata sp.]|nr:hypothetical protein [Gemmata sp.]